MATEFVESLRVADLTPLSGNYGDNSTVQVGSLRGRRLLKSDTKGYAGSLVIPANLTMGTGLTFKALLVDDGKNAADLGLVVRLGFTVKKIAPGTDTLDIAVSAGTEQTVDVTLNATAGVAVAATLAIAAANLDSAAVGDRVLVRIRRVGTASQDTCLGEVMLADPVYVFNT